MKCGLLGPHFSFGNLYIERGEIDMANLMLEFTKGFASTLVPQSLTDLKSDADEIREALMGGAKTATDKYREIRRSPFFKKTTDWLFRRSDEFSEGSSLDDDRDDEFDAGFKFGGDDDDKEPESKPLDADSMKSIVRGQVSSMYQIAGKQAEASAMTTSEIINTIDTRASEVLSSLGSINSSLSTIASKIDKIIELNTIQKKNNDTNRRSLFDSYGNLTLGNTASYLIENNPFQAYISGLRMIGSFLPTIFNTGNTAENIGTLAGMGLGMFSDKKWKMLGNRSFDDITEAINERVENFQTEALSKLLDTKGFKFLFGDLTRRESNKDYSTYVENQYDTKRAVFDNMTRKSIVDIIPGYLRRITAALTGENLFISYEGNLSTERESGFKEKLRTSTMADGFKSDKIKEISDKNSDIDKNDLRLAQRVLTTLYVYHELRAKTNVTKPDDFINGGDPNVNAKAAELLTTKGGKDRSYWDHVIEVIVGDLVIDKKSRDNFAKTIRRTAASSDKRLMNYAKTATITYDIKEIDDAMVDETVGSYIKNAFGKDDRTWQERVDAKEIKATDIPIGVDPNSRISEEDFKRQRRERQRQSEITGYQGKNAVDIHTETIDYLSSIFAILNRGINVYVMKDGPFAPMNLLSANKTQKSSRYKLSRAWHPLQQTANTSDEDTKIETTEQPNEDKEPTQQPEGETKIEMPDIVTKIETAADKLESIVTGKINSIDTDKIKETFKSGYDKYMKTPIDKIREKFDTAKTNIMTDLKSLKARTFDTVKLDVDKVMAKRDIDKLSDSEDDQNDKAIADAVLAAMNASTADGETQEDIGPLIEQISGIKNEKLKSRLTRIVEGTLQRSESKKPAQSKLGKVLTWGLGLVKAFILPKLSSAKTFLTGLGKKLLAPILNSLKSSGQKIARGATAVKEGLFGSEDSRGIFGGAVDSLKDKFKKTTEPQMESIGRLDIGIARSEQKLAEKNKTKAETPQMDSIEDMMKPKEEKKPEMESIETPKSSDDELKKDVKKLVQDSEENKKGDKEGNAITRAMNNFMEKFKKTEFGQGFMSAFEKKKGISKEMKPETLADQMSKSIHDILKSKDGSGTIFGTIVNKITSIGDVFKEGIQKITEKQNTQDTSSTTTTETPSIGGGDTGSSEQASSQPEMDGISTSSSGGMEAAGRNSMASISTPDATSAATSAAGGAAAKKGIGFSIGKMLGGITGILGGLLQAVMTIVMGMKGFKMIVKLGMKTLTNILKPLNSAFKTIYKAIKPVMKSIQKVLKQLVSYVVEIVESVISAIQPILEMIGPLLEQLMEALQPFLELITDVVNVILIPLTAVIQTVVVPVVQTIGNTLEIIFGIVQVGIGLILTALGGILTAVGVIGKILGAGSLYDTGKNVIEEGNRLIDTGGQHVSHGFQSQQELARQMLSNVLGTNDQEQEEETQPSTRQRTIDTLNGSPMDGLYGNGDTSFESIYGGAGANQNRFGNYLNMSQRGCGPVALADAYSRRYGSSVNARGLTSSMASAGAYSPSMGTSVGGFMAASSSMGMNLRAGGVTPASLKQATPNNPITIVGSGTDFTTRKGNNHYMNVIGSSGGTAYVSNPMNGRVERRSVTSLAANSVVGLYGSGDVPPVDMKNVYGSGDAGFQFSDGVQDALENLKEIVQNIINIFTGDDTVEGNLKKAKEKESYNKAMTDVGNMSDEEKQKLEKEAFEEYKKENPRFEGETDADYEKRFKKENYYMRYMTIAARNRVEDEAKKSAGYEEGTVGYIVNNALGEIDPETGERKGGFVSDFMTSLKSYDDSVEQGMFYNQLQEMIGDGYWDEEGGESGFYSDNGARLYTDEYEPTVFDVTDGTSWRSSKGDWIDVPLHEWMKNNIPEMGGMSSAYKRYGPPANEEVEGLAGSDHSGTDFYGPAGTILRATTDGVVTFSGESGGAGNAVNIEDVGGDIHQYFHMLEPSPLKVGDIVYGGDEIGKLGSTGNSTGPHLHYQIKSADNVLYNPHTFFKWHEGSEGSAPYGPIDYEGQLEQGDAWPSHVNDTGVSTFMKTAFEAGLTGPEVAAISSMGIWEDGGRKLWGDKSLINVTHDKYGQQATGIMNWVDTSINYGDTIEKQLQYVQRTYFDENSDDWRALVRHVTDPKGKNWDAEDLAAYKEATGRSGWDLDWGERYGPLMNSDDLIEGSEHWYRGALVPECIHTVEGPRKYIGTAVGVYNWLLDEGYISEGDGMSRIWRSSDNDDYYDDYYDDSTYEDIGATAAGNTVASNAARAGDKTSGIPGKYTAKTKGSKGTAYNEAGQKLFDYYIPSGNSMADGNACKYKSKKEISANFGAGKFEKIWVDMNSFPATTAGNNAKQYVNKGVGYSTSSSTVVSSSSSSNKSTTTGLQQISTPKITDSDILDVVNDIYKSGVYGSSGRRTYISNWDSLNLNNKISKLNTTYDNRGTKYNLTKQMISSAMAEAAVEKNARDTEASRVANQHRQTIEYMKSLQNSINNWKNSKEFWSTYGNGDVDIDMSYILGSGPVDAVIPEINIPDISGSTSIVGTGNTDQSVIDTSSVPDVTSTLIDLFTTSQMTGGQTSAPIVVNKYDIPQDNYEVINALLNNTYNVRSAEIEAMLDNMLMLMKERNQQRKQRTTTTRSNKSPKGDALFSEQGIPRQVERLSVG